MLATVCKQTARWPRVPFRTAVTNILSVRLTPSRCGNSAITSSRRLGGAEFGQFRRRFFGLLDASAILSELAEIPFPIRGLQANEMTRNYPVPIEATLAITGMSTDYPRPPAQLWPGPFLIPNSDSRIGR